MRDAFWRRWMSRMPFMAGAVAASPAAARPAAAVPAASAVPDPSAAPAMLGDIDPACDLAGAGPQAHVGDRSDPARAGAVAGRGQPDHAALQVRGPHPHRRAGQRVPAPDRRACRGARASLDAEAVTSQGQLLLSRDLARRSSRRTGSPSCGIRSGAARRLALRTLLALFGIGKDPFKMTPRSASSKSYYSRFTAYAVEKSRVMVIEFQSHDPELAARAPTPSPTATWCCSRPRARTRPRRRRNGCWARSTICARRSRMPRRGSRTSAPSQPVRRHQQHHAVEPAARRGQFAAQQRARAEGRRGIEGPMIREMLQSGRPIEASECSTRPGPAPVRAARDAARPACRTVLDAARRPSAHQGMKAQILDIDRQIARRPARSPVRWKTTPASPARASTASTPARPIETPGDLHNGQDVQLRALEREAKAQRDLLESYLAKYREATTRENIDIAPSDGRIISRAIVVEPPAFPKKLPWC